MFRTLFLKNLPAITHFKHLKPPIIFKNDAVEQYVPKTKHLSAKVTTHSVPDINISHTYEQYDDMKIYNISFNTKLPYVKPALFQCIIDVSGSMNESAVGNSNDVESSKFSKLDLVKHALKTIVHVLRDVDKMSVIVFNESSYELFPVLEMNIDNKKIALEKIESIDAYGGTNIWDGLKSAQYIDTCQLCNVFNLLLTDGQSNRDPPRGVLHEFQLKNKHNIATTHIFAFGHGADHELLFNLSHEGSGLFSYINDHTMCNTIFINYLSACLATCINNVNIKFETGANTKLKIFGNNWTNDILAKSNGKFKMGGLLNNQTQNLLLGTNNDVILHVNLGASTLNYSLNSTSKLNELTPFQYAKTYTIEHILKKLEGENITTDSIFDYVKNMELNTNTLPKCIPLISALCDDIKHQSLHKGQIEKAFSAQDSWGIPYLKSWIRSHQLQICSNFKDASLQHYGNNSLFGELRNEIEEIFKHIPPPKASRATQNNPYRGNFQQATYNPSGPCFGGLCETKTLHNDELKYVYVKDLKKGDIVLDSNNIPSKILCVIKTKIHLGMTGMARISCNTHTGMQLCVTPYHPIKVNNVWVFPKDITDIYDCHLDHIYNFVLDKHHIMNISGIDVITMGHNYIDGILKHPFFGSKLVVNELKKGDPVGWNNGLIEFNKKYEPVYDTSGTIISFGKFK